MVELGSGKAYLSLSGVSNQHPGSLKYVVPSETFVTLFKIKKQRKKTPNFLVIVTVFGRWQIVSLPYVNSTFTKHSGFITGNKGQI